jgi:molybdopterin/thiamine biosynthesis adenylyltransferase
MFDHKKAFSRNLGWVTEAESEVLKNLRVATAGCGGVGGEHLLTLARLGISNFKISDIDTFETQNLNRQAFCFTSTLNENKVEVAESFLKDVNPNIKIVTYEKGINKENVSEFLEDIDIYIDTIDIYAIKERIEIFKECKKRNIPIFTAGPLGMGTSYLCFDHKKTDVIKYFDFKESDSNLDGILKFLLGLSPNLLHTKYIADKHYVNIKRNQTPSIAMGVKAASAALGTEVLKYALQRGSLIVAPTSIQIDFYRHRITKPTLKMGNRGPIQRIKLLY